jgi:hypothetical protein
MNRMTAVAQARRPASLPPQSEFNSALVVAVAG